LVDGGVNVVVKTSGGAVQIGSDTTANALTGAPLVAAGIVSITDTFGGPSDDLFIVRGGTTVSATMTATKNGIGVAGPILQLRGIAQATFLNGTTLAKAYLDPPGNVTINNSTDNTANGGGIKYGTGATNVAVNGADTVSITGGRVQNILDVEATLQ